jgi:SAM-dependent methyltransferase
MDEPGMGSSLPTYAPAPDPAATLRLNWGCGSHIAPGWINSDIKDGPSIDLACDIRDGLPLERDSIDYVVSIHALQELPCEVVVPVLRELRRVLKPSGVLRLGLPDLRKAIHAYLSHEADYFLVPDHEAASWGGRFITHILWYGHSRTLFTSDYAHELLLKAGYVDVVECAPHQTVSRFAEIVMLDNREKESFYVEALKDGSLPANP